MAQVLVGDVGGTKIGLGHLSKAPASKAWVPGGGKGVEPLPSSLNPLELIPTDRLRVPDPVEAMAQILGEYTEKHALEPQAAVLGVPVSPDRDLDRVLSSPNIPQLEGLWLASALRQRLGYPVYLERDIALLLLGEYRAGSAKGANSVLGVFFGTGVGAAMLLDGKPYRGYSVGLELGHIPIRSEGRVCVCGNTDCLEAYASGHTLVELSSQSEIPLSRLFARRRESGFLSRALKRFVHDQAYAVATAINLFDPEVCVIGGGIPAMSEYPQRLFELTVLEHLRRPYPRETVRMAWAALGPRAALYGALEVLSQRQDG
ncbi:MAG: ROK family protein [Thermaceae bacterium]|nr:ROK family protein [Thermaceae bacterium]